ncbi:Duf1262 family protein [Thalictrum thalictroides]|uniref:Duf1262 family protein n=1 Tax=Thalictrum thalictroides TaxID=46969 RepID=A0A7J6WER2_THATH|nr:Duf1262 family protein [Thalictrum thalictroides]
MKDRGKAVAISSSSSSNWFSDYQSSSELPCRKHPSSSTVGICALCLKDRLIKLVCSDCGEQRLSSCSCSDISSSYRNSCTLDIGSVEATVLLKRSSSTSTSVDIKKGGFWKFGRLFRKRREENDFDVLGKNFVGVDEKGDMWANENKGVSRSQSLCGLRGGFDDFEGIGSNVSTGRPSDLSRDGKADSKKKSGGFNGVESLTIGGKFGGSEDVLVGKKRHGSFSLISESTKKNGFSDFDGEFCRGENPDFIDLKLGISSESKPQFSSVKSNDFCDGYSLGQECQSFNGLKEGMFSNGSSCRITVNNNEIKKCKKSFKVWKWIIKHHSSNAGRPSWKKDEEHDTKLVYVVYGTSGEHSRVQRDKVWFIPVPDQPLSSNRYYVIIAEGKYKGQACTCSKEEDMVTCCFCCTVVKDVKPRDLDYNNIYQQVEIFKQRWGYSAKSVAPDGYPPLFLRRQIWTVDTSSSFQCQLSEAHGLNFALRTKLPEFNFPDSNKRLVVGKWYCPFVFIKEQRATKDQMEKSLLYEMTLEQWWEEIYTCNNDYSGNNIVSFIVNVQKEVNSLSGLEAVKDDTNGVAETTWYKCVDSAGGRVSSLGLSKAIVDKMTWVQEMGGWVGGNDTDVEVKRTEEFKEGKDWQRFSYFVLVERFCLRRMDGTLLLACDFRHTHHIQSKWEYTRHL